MSDECKHGSLRRSCEICDRDAEIERLRSGHDEAVKQHNMIIDHYKQRIEELERDLFTVLSRDIGEDIQEFNHAHGVYEITTEQLASGEVVLLTQGQIDWAWRVASSEEPYTDDCLAELGIVACEECGGSGMIGNPSSSDQVCICHDCGGHGWVWKEVTKDEQ